EEQKLAIGDRDDLLHAGEPCRAPIGAGDQARAVRQLDERLGEGVARQRPEPGACAAADDDGDEGHVLFLRYQNLRAPPFTALEWPKPGVRTCIESASRPCKPKW